MSGAAETAELVVLGPVHPGGRSGRVTDAVAVRGTSVLALGDQARAAIGPRTRVLEAGDGLVLPGFVDAHVHPVTAGRTVLTADLNELPDAAAELAAVARYAAGHPDAEWITGGGWSMEHHPGGLPLATDLDAATGIRPAFLFNRDVHGAWLNSAALQRGGITAATPDPPDGRIERDASGAPTGVLHEGAATAFEDAVVPAPSVADWADALRTGQTHLHRLGLTGWQDAWVTPDQHRAYLRLAATGELTARVVGAQWWDRHRGVEQIDELRQRRAQGTGPYSAGTVKIMLDGVMENRTAAMLEPYSDGSGSGLLYVEPAALADAVTRLDALDFQVHLHAIGDRAVRVGLDAVAAAGDANGPRDNRHQIAHLQLIDPVDVPRFAALGVTATVQTFWAQHEPQMDDLTVPGLGPERAGRQYAFAELSAAGARLALGSDWPVTTADPLAQLEVAVTRRPPGSRHGRRFLPAQRLGLAAAVRALTAGSAFVNHDPAGGTLSPGARADMVVLSRNIFECAPAEIAATGVRFTVVAGKVVAGH